MSDYDMTELKRKARDNHIDENGRTERRNIFATVVLDVLEIPNYEPWDKKYHEDDFEEAWKHTERSRCAVMEKTTAGGYKVYTVFSNGDTSEVKEFGFSEKKHAESELLSQLDEHS